MHEHLLRYQFHLLRRHRQILERPHQVILEALEAPGDAIGLAGKTGLHLLLDLGPPGFQLADLALERFALLAQLVQRQIHQGAEVSRTFAARGLATGNLPVGFARVWAWVLVRHHGDQLASR